MSATNHTANYNLPQFIGSDKPAWLTDVNGAMSAIDLGIAAAQAKADGADTKADTVGANLETLSGSVTTLDTAVTTLSGTVTSQGGTINTITSLIGNGEPTTTDKTIIGAINEVNAKVGNVDAADVSYTNTTSGLTADDVQEAIDELKADIDAIQPGGGGADLNFTVSGDFTVTTSNGTVTANKTDVKLLANADKSIGKIYGNIQIASPTMVASSWNTIATLTNSEMPTVSAAYDINIGFSWSFLNNDIDFMPTRLHFNTDGTVEVQVYSGGAYTYGYIGVSLTPCIYILKDLGD